MMKYIEVIKQKLNTISKQDPSLYAQIIQSFTILYKYSLLQASRKLYHLQYAELEDLMRYEIVDRYCKIHIYQQSIENPLEILDKLSERVLKKIALCNLHTLAEKLQKQKQNLLVQIKNWESDLQYRIAKNHQCQSWKNYLSSKFKQITRKIYQHSLIGLSGELIGWLGRVVGLREISHPAGVILGIGLTYLTGWPAILQQFLISFGGKMLHDYFCVMTLNDEDASVIKQNSFFAELNFTYLLLLINASFNGYYQRQWRPLIQGLCALIGNFSCVAVAKTLVKPLRTKPETENQIYTLVLIALGGAELGRYAANIGLDIFEPYLLCRIFAARFLKENFPDVFFQQALCPPLFSATAPVKIEWSSKLGFFRMNCHLIHTDSKRNEEINVLCDSPEQSPLVPLAPC